MAFGTFAAMGLFVALAMAAIPAPALVGSPPANLPALRARLAPRPRQE